MASLDKLLNFVGLQRAVAAAPERRSSLENPQTPLSYPAEWLLDIFNGGRTDSGIRVSEMSALQVSTVLACVNIIANGVAGLPLNVYEVQKNKNRMSKIVSYDHAIYDLLAWEPNIEMNSVTWRKTMQCHALLWGNGYCEIERDKANRIIGLWPRNPARTRPVRITNEVTVEGTTYRRGTMMYETYEHIYESRLYSEDNTDNEMTPRRIILAEDMIHIHGLSLDGRLGQNIVQMARQAIGLALATEKYGAKFFGNGAIPTGVLKVAGEMSEQQFEVLQRSWMERHGGENMHKTSVLPPGVEYQKTGATPGEGQMLEARKFQRQEIAAIFNVPPHMVGEIDRATKSTVEQSAIEFVLFSLGPWLAEWESELRRKLFGSIGRNAGKYFAKFDVRRLMYPDAKARGDLYALGKQWGFLSTNDIRELEDMNPISNPSGDKYWMATNMTDADSASAIADAHQDALKDGTVDPVPPGTQLKPPPTPPGGADDAKGKPPAKTQPPKKEAKSAADFIRIYEKLVKDAFGRAAFRKKATPGDFMQIFVPCLANIANVVAWDVIETVPDAEPCNEPEVLRFIGNYVNELFARAPLNADVECPAAITAIHAAVWKSMCVVDVRAESDDPEKRLLFMLRHGTTPYNEAKQDRYREWTDVDLDAEGIAVVQKAAEKLKGLGINRIITSPLKRCQHSADIVAQALGLTVELDEGLNTWKHGYGGKTKDEAGAAVQKLIDNPDTKKDESSESLNEFMARSQKAIDKLHDDNVKTPGSTLLSTSGSNIASWQHKGTDVGKALDEKAKGGPGSIVQVHPNKTIKYLWTGEEGGSGKPS